MKFKIHHYDTNDWFIIEGESIEDCKKEARSQTEKRGWKSGQAWSEKII